MLDALFDESFTVRKAGSRNAKNEVVYQEVLDETGGPLRVPARISRRGRRIFDKQGSETESDGTALFRKPDILDLDLEDLIVTTRGEAFKILALDEEKALFGGASYHRADLRKTRLPVPEDVHAE